MKHLSKILAIVLVIASILSFSSCGKKISKEEAISYAKELISASYEVNEIYFGNGLPYDEEYSYLIEYHEAEDSDVEVPIYIPISKTSKYKTIQELKDLASKVYSKDYCEYLYTLAFEGFASEDQAVYSKYMDSDEFLSLTVKYEKHPIMEEQTNFDLNNITVNKILDNKVYLTVAANENGIKQNIKITLVKEYDSEMNAIWRLDTPTY